MVKFDMTKNKIHNMVVWRYAYEQARKGHWQTVALDRCRFARRVEEANQVLGYVLDCNHRKRICLSLIHI